MNRADALLQDSDDEEADMGPPIGVVKTLLDTCCSELEFKELFKPYGKQLRDVTAKLSKNLWSVFRLRDKLKRWEDDISYDPLNPSTIASVSKIPKCFQSIAHDVSKRSKYPIEVAEKFEALEEQIRITGTISPLALLQLHVNATKEAMHNIQNSMVSESQFIEACNEVVMYQHSKINDILGFELDESTQQRCSVWKILSTKYAKHAYHFLISTFVKNITKKKEKEKEKKDKLEEAHMKIQCMDAREIAARISAEKEWAEVERKNKPEGLLHPKDPRSVTAIVNKEFDIKLPAKPQVSKPKTRRQVSQK